MEKRKWEKIAEDTERLEIEGGWLVRTAFCESVSICFVKDPTHCWELEETPIPSCRILSENKNLHSNLIQ